MKLIMKTLQACVVGGLLVGTATAEGANEDKWMVKVGAATLSLEDEATIAVGGQLVPGGTIKTKDQTTPVVEVSRYISDQFALSVTVGLPPRVEIDAAGTLEGVGRLANVDYGPSAVTLQYHPFRGKRVDPYIGAGFSYMLITNTQDAAMRNVEVENDLGAALQVGVNIAITDKVGVFLDAKKAYLSTTATGTFNGLPAVAEVVMDPMVLSAGASITF